MRNDCHAFGEQNGRLKCSITTYSHCRDDCPFFATREGAEAGRGRANDRLLTLQREYQRGIAQKYYGGKMPWVEEEVR